MSTGLYATYSLYVPSYSWEIKWNDVVPLHKQYIDQAKTDI